MNVDTPSAFKIIYSGVLMTLNANLSQSQYVGFRWVRKIIMLQIAVGYNVPCHEL